jgi:hypothetical protein
MAGGAAPLRIEGGGARCATLRRRDVVGAEMLGTGGCVLALGEAGDVDAGDASDVDAEGGCVVDAEDGSGIDADGACDVDADGDADCASEVDAEGAEDGAAPAPVVPPPDTVAPPGDRCVAAATGAPAVPCALCSCAVDGAAVVGTESVCADGVGAEEEGVATFVAPLLK